MKGMIKKFLKIFLISIGVLCCVILVILSIFAVQGYKTYKNSIELEPFANKVESIRKSENFTPYNALPEFYVKSVIAVEDQRFMSHCGFDPIAIGRALLNDIKSLSLVEGGSTITQQLAKNLYFTQEKTLDRKFAEIFMAMEIEKLYSKEEILELYVNTIYFGSGYYGITQAAQAYFNKQPQNLTDYECAMLAGIPNAPSAYSPNTNPALAEQRLCQVLNRMVDQGEITEDDASYILSEK